MTTKMKGGFWIGTEVADGPYIGTWSGYRVTMKVDGFTVTFQTEIGVRGLDVPVTVTVKDGAATVETL